MIVSPATLVEVLGAAAGRLPRPLALAAGRRLGDAMALLVRSRRRLALANLERALGGEMDAPARRRLMREVFRQFGQTLVEALLLPRMVRRGLHHYVEHEGWEHLEQAMAQGKGAIVFTGHFGNWEVVALAQGARGIPMDVVGRPPDDPRLAARLESIRQLTGNRTISKRQAVRPMLQSLRQGRTVGLVVDQNVGAGRGIFVDFFGRPASTTPALAVLALKTGAPVVPVFGYPDQGGRHRIVYGRPLEVTRSGDHQRDVRELTARATAVIERAVRRHPQLWLWLHDRWRSRPPQEPAASGSQP